MHPIWGPQPSLTDGAVVLEPFQLHDAATMVEWDRDPEMARWFDWTTSITSDDAHLEHCQRVVRGCHEDFEAGNRAAFIVRDADSGAPLGSVELRFPEPARAEASYSTISQHRGRGIATNALRLVCSWGFDVVRVERIQVTCDVANASSRRVAEKAGFAEIAVIPGAMRYEAYEPWIDQAHDAVRYERAVTD